MEILSSKNIRSNYHIYKGFGRHLPGPLDCFIKTNGLDCVKKKSEKRKEKACNEIDFRYVNGKFCDFLVAIFSSERKLKKSKTKQKRRHYEELEEAI